ncbi:MAG: ribonuclease J [Phyllobacteriaceae bacterium]|nr:ribonuclease J [Phyllobacteriaceae bacterium]
MTDTAKSEFVFVPLGGVGEIGMNFALYGYGPPKQREWIVVDCGVTFPDAEHPGVDLILPDIAFIKAQRDRLRAIVVTHAHEDHYGALSDLWPDLRVPVWATPFTAGLMEAKRQEEPGSPKIPVTIYKAGDRFEIGPFAIEAINVTHSIPEPVALAITTAAGTVIHTGDWKIDEAPTLGGKTDEARFRALGDKGVLALICDSTNAMVEGESPTETAVSESLRQVIETAPGRVAITTFSSHVGRIRSIALAARDAGRQVLVLGRSMKRVIDVSTELGYLDGLPAFLPEDRFGFIPRDKAVIILTGSQGEPRAALSKLARDEMKNVALSAGDIVIYSSRAIPGNEKAILQVKNALIDQGIKIVGEEEALVHVSGHPRRGDLRKMYEWTRPKIAVPVHGEAAHLTAHASLAAMSGVREVATVRNGDVLRLGPGAAEIVDKVRFGRVFKDGKLVGTEEEMAIGERRKLSFVGHVAVNVVFDDRAELAGEPDLVAIGVPEKDTEGETIENLLLDAATQAVQSIPRQRRKDLDLVAEAVRRAVRAAAEDAWGKKPVVTVFVTQ